MFFDKSYIERICSPDILVDDRYEQSISKVVKTGNDMNIEGIIYQVEELGLRYEFEERAAILEYDGGLTREEAEKQALQEISERNKADTKKLKNNTFRS